ncbi:MAG: LPS assembly protein LptD [Terracidiphilus sp.]
MQTHPGSHDPGAAGKIRIVCCQSRSDVVLKKKASLFCYPDFGPWMRLRSLFFITMLSLCHLQMRGQTLTNTAPPALLPDDPSQEILPVAQLEPQPVTGEPVQWEAGSQSRVGDIWTLSGGVTGHYRGYTLRADKVVYHQSTSEVEAEGHLEISGGPNDVLILADHGEIRINTHTARYFNVHGSQGFRTNGHTKIYSTTAPFTFSGRVVLELGEGHYKIIDGTITNCRLPKPDWQIISRAISVEDGKASTSNALFKFLGVPLFYLPYLSHPVDETGRSSGILIPAGENSTIKGLVIGEQFYWVISRNMDMIGGVEYWSKRGWAPNGDFRYRGAGLNHATVRWNALLDRGIEESIPSTISGQPATTKLENQGGVDINAEGRKDLSDETRLAGKVEYLSSYIYRLVFNDNYALATTSEVQSNLSLTHAHNWFVPSLLAARFQSFAGTSSTTDAAAVNGNQVRILHLPTLRIDLLDHPLGASTLYGGLGSSLSYLSRSEPGEPLTPTDPNSLNGASFHARNIGRLDVYPHLLLPLSGGGWNLTAELALRETAYTKSQYPDWKNKNGGVPTISHDPLNRTDFEVSIDLRPPAVERDFTLDHWNRQMRHVIEPEITYRYVDGIGKQARNVLLVDTTDIATNTNEVGYSLTQRLFLRPTHEKPCSSESEQTQPRLCPPQGREWASWQIAQKFFINSNFGGALLSNKRNVFDSTLDMSAIAYLTSPRNVAPITSRLRFEVIDNLRIQWDLDYDPKAGRLDADNLYAGYSWDRTTIGVGHAMLNAVEESANSASVLKSQQVQPFLTIGKQNSVGFNLAANGGYDFVLGQFQYWGTQATYNWDCCGLTFGYRRFNLGSIRGEDSQWLYSFTLANFGSVPGISRSKSVFRDPTLPPAY